ncbi:MAG TPA: DNA repair exonuclease [Planctomycetota bacterium]|jgi:DNA repair exonuclease SbcCD nuclease subunit
MDLIRVLFLADTHLGFDQPARPRVERRRRGPDFFANTQRALEPALRGEVDFVVHGGDLLYRSRVPPSLVDAAFAPLKQVADAGVPVLLVPGNHERSHIPHALLSLHPNIHVFDRPRTFVLNVRNVSVAFAGFPFVGNGVRGRFRELIERTQGLATAADIRLLCIHECVDGAKVGPANYTFRDVENVVNTRDLPPGFGAVLAGHIHRRQTLTTDLYGRTLSAPVLYPGSIERTSIAEKDETKGYLRLDFAPNNVGGALAAAHFATLPARPMVVAQIQAGVEGPMFEQQVREAIGQAPADAVLVLRVAGEPTSRELAMLSAPILRTIAPPTMNVSVAMPHAHRVVGGANVV